MYAVIRPEACAYPLELCEPVHLHLLQGNVKDAEYDVDFFRSFDLVLNGLDNMEARRHVNRLALAAGTPLVESGTEGYLGQVCGAGPVAVCSVLRSRAGWRTWIRRPAVWGRDPHRR